MADETPERQPVDHDARWTTAPLATRVETHIGLNTNCGGTEGVYRLRDLIMGEVQPELDRLTAERDEALRGAHLLDRRRPTVWAYEQACKALEKHRQRADAAERERERLRSAWRSARRRASRRQPHEREGLIFHLERQNRRLSEFADLADHAVTFVNTRSEETKADRDRARGIAVALEQQNAEVLRLLTAAAQEGEWAPVADAIKALGGPTLVPEEITALQHRAPDEWINCAGWRCPNAERYAKAQERGWRHWAMGQWLCADCSARQAAKEQEADRG